MHHPGEITVVEGIVALIKGACLLALSYFLTGCSPLPDNYESISSDLLTLGEFRKAPIVNNACTQMWYARSLSNSLGVFRLDLQTLQSSLVDEITVLDDGADHWIPYGWSPDDRYFLCATTLDDQRLRQHILIYDGTEGKLINSIEAGERMIGGLWLTTNKFAYLDRSKTLYLQQIGLDATTQSHRLGKPHPVKQFAKESSMHSLLRISEQTIAYVENQNIWSLDLKTTATRQLSYLPNANLEWVNYSSSNRCYLFCSNSDDSPQGTKHLFRFNPKTGSKGKLEQLTFGSDNSYNGRWVNEGAGYVYVSNPTNRTYLAVRGDKEQVHTDLFHLRYVRAFSVSPRGDKVYAVASLGAEPQGIWEYTLTTGELRPLVSGTNRPFVSARIIEPLRLTFKSDKEKEIPYWMLLPPKLDPKKKYPVLIDTPVESRFRATSQFLANVGIIYVAVDRYGLSSSDRMEEAANDILSLYPQLIRHPSVDSRRVFLMGASGGTAVVCELLNAQRQLWRGAILNQPTAFPNLGETDRLPPLLVLIGKEDPNMKRALEFEQLAKQHSLNATIVYFENASHMFRTTELGSERDQKCAEFVLRR